MPAVWSSTRLLEFDFAGIEQVVMGWCMADPAYIRIAKLGTHAIVASHELHRPADLSWSDADLGAYLKTIKKSPDDAVQQVYDRSKRCVHGVAYGLTTHGMVRNFPKTFRTLKQAERIQEVYFALAPGVPQFHTVVRDTAHRTHALGGGAAYDYRPAELKVIGHPFGYRHWFWSVVAYERLSESQRIFRQKRRMPLLEINGIWWGITLGEDAKRAVAFYPQSIARGVLTEASLPLFDRDDPRADTCYIGDLYYGTTPLRAPIHDSLFVECPTRYVDRLIERVALSMQAPVIALVCPPEWGMGSALTIGVDAKIGDDWGHMSPVTLPSALGVSVDRGVANDTVYTPAEEADEEDVLDLGLPVSA